MDNDKLRELFRVAIERYEAQQRFRSKMHDKKAALAALEDYREGVN